MMFGKPKKKRSFFEKLTGAVPVDDFDDDFEFEEQQPERRRRVAYEEAYEDEEEFEQPVAPISRTQAPEKVQDIVEHGDGQLAVDVVNTDDALIVRAMLAGVKASDIDIDITRDMVTIRGTREEDQEITLEDYYHRELFWGSFSRNIILPEEIDVEEAEAVEKHGLITLHLPKLDKNRKTKLAVKSK